MSVPWVYGDTLQLLNTYELVNMTPALASFKITINHFCKSQDVLSYCQKGVNVFISPVPPWTAQNLEGTWVWTPAGWREQDTPDVWQGERDCGVINECACHATCVFLILWSINSFLWSVLNWPNSCTYISWYNIDILTQNVRLMPNTSEGDHVTPPHPCSTKHTNNIR